VAIYERPAWLAVGSAHAVKKREISCNESMQSGFEAYYSQVDLPIDCVACIDETTAGLVSPNGYYLYGSHVGWPLTYYRQEGAFPQADIAAATSPGTLPICGDR